MGESPDIRIDSIFRPSFQNARRIHLRVQLSGIVYQTFHLFYAPRPSSERSFRPPAVSED